MPVPGDVDVVVAAELMEAGRAVVRGFVSPDRTTLVASTHRVYGITEKSALGDGIADSKAVLAALKSEARRVVSFDMDAICAETGSVISSVLFGALAARAYCRFRGSFTRRRSPRAASPCETSLKGFAAGFERALASAPAAAAIAPGPPPTTEQGRRLDAKSTRGISGAPARAHRRGRAPLYGLSGRRLCRDLSGAPRPKCCACDVGGRRHRARIRV